MQNVDKICQLCKITFHTSLKITPNTILRKYPKYIDKKIIKLTMRSDQLPHITAITE